MSEIRYPAKISRSSSHSLIVKTIGQLTEERAEIFSPLRVLDIGCSTGGLYESIKDMNITYLGVEPFSKDAELARNKGVDVHSISAEEAVTSPLGVFDLIVFADVLEHLVNPIQVLGDSKNSLCPHGLVIVSCPNVAHISNRLFLFFGKWNYTDRGILDRTHLRFFTTKSLAELIREAGFEILEQKFSSVPLEALVSKGNNRWVRVLDVPNMLLTKLHKGLFGYQTIILAKKLD